MKKIGAKSFDIIYFMNTFSLKKEFLYFDEIYYNEDTLERNAKIGKWLSTLVRKDDGNLHDWRMYEIELLKKEGVLIPFQPVSLDSYEECQSFHQQTDVRKILKDMGLLHDQIVQELQRFIDRDFDGLQKAFNHSSTYSDLEALLLARSYNFKKSGCVPIVQPKKSLNIKDPLLSQALVVNTIIQDFPIICVTTDWPDITRYKADSKVQEYLLALKNWLIDLNKSEFTAEELDDRLAYFKSEYVKHATYHELKVKYSSLENNVFTPLSILENVIKGNFTEIGKTFLDKKKENIELKIEEANLKFQEVAYLVNTTKVFDNDKSRLVKEGVKKKIG